MLTSPYEHLYNTDNSLLRTVRLSQKCQKSYIPYPFNTDTSVKRTLGSVTLLSVLKRFDYTCLTKLDQAVSICGFLLNFDKDLKIDFEDFEITN